MSKKMDHLTTDWFWGSKIPINCPKLTQIVKKIKAKMLPSKLMISIG